MIFKNSVKNGWLKSRNLSGEKKPTPSTNIPLLSFRKSEQYVRFCTQFCRASYFDRSVHNGFSRKVLKMDLF